MTADTGLAALKQALPDHARDIRLNLGSVLGASPLPARQVWGTAVAVAVSCRNAVLLTEIEKAALEHLSAGEITAAKGAGSIMAMNNIYYRAKHLIGDEGYAALPARLRMQIIGNPGVDKVDFELWCLAVSAVTGCGVCLESHNRALLDAGLPRETVHEALRIASVLHATAVTLDAERTG